MGGYGSGVEDFSWIGNVRGFFLYNLYHCAGYVWGLIGPGRYLFLESFIHLHPHSLKSQMVHLFSWRCLLS